MTKVSELKEASVREAFSKAVDREALEKELFQGMTLSDRLIPPSVTLLGNRYVNVVPSPEYPPYKPGEALAAYRLGLEALNISQMSNIRFLVEDTASTRWLASCLQQMWQKELGVYVKLTLVSASEMQSRLEDKTYDIALTSLTPRGSNPGDILSNFSTDHMNNVTGYSSQQYDAYLVQAMSARQQEDILKYYSYGETLLAQDLPALPLWAQTSYRVNGRNVSGIEYFPDPSRTYFKTAQRIK